MWYVEDSQRDQWAQSTVECFRKVSSSDQNFDHSFLSHSEETLEHLIKNMFSCADPPDCVIINGINFLLTFLERRYKAANYSKYLFNLFLVSDLQVHLLLHSIVHSHLNLMSPLLSTTRLVFSSHIHYTSSYFLTAGNGQNSFCSITTIRKIPWPSSQKAKGELLNTFNKLCTLYVRFDFCLSFSRWKWCWPQLVLSILLLVSWDYRL